VIRGATAADAEAIDGLHVRAWQHAYGDFIAPEDQMAARDEDERVARWRERMDSTEIATWVWDQDGYVAGFASAGGGELWALYIDPAAQNAGVGSALLAHAEAAMKAEGASEATLWVFSANEHGRRFYEGRGWSLVPGSEEQGDWVAAGVCYRKDL
jgi:ribosomal protein S18 acetylase RimI-like enzyme